MTTDASAASPTVPMTALPIRVASVPASHAYVRNSTANARRDGLIELLPDPQPAGVPIGQWWPPVVLGPHWIETNSDTFDVVHVHFGFESFSCEQLAARLAQLKRMNRPFVLTVHDLENPQLRDQHGYERLVELLVLSADELITLTPGAAREIEARWGRAATVIAHPWMAAGSRGGSAATPPATPAAMPSAIGNAIPPGAAVRVGVHLRDLRPNIDAVTTVRHLLAAERQFADSGTPIEVVVDINATVRDDDTKRELQRLVAARPTAIWNEHPRFDDDELEASLSALDVSVLPYRHGTHSGWIELCWDLGVGVLAPAIGFYAEQHREPDALASYEPGSYKSFFAALSRLSGESLSGEARQLRRATLSSRRMDARGHQARDISASLVSVYRRALGRVAA